MTRVERRRLIRRRRIFVACVCAALIAAVILVSVLVNAVKKAGDGKDKPLSNDVTQSQAVTSGEANSDESSSDNTSSDNKKPQKNAKSVTVLNTGDVLIHDNLLSGAKQTDGSYDFSKFFMHSRKYINAANLAIANLEVTLGGEAAGNYRGYPGFNSPDSLIDYLKADGFDLLLTSNNHSLDTGAAGLKRTVQ